MKIIVSQFACDQYTLLHQPMHKYVRFRASKNGFNFFETEFAVNFGLFLRWFASPTSLFTGDLKSLNYPRKAEALNLKTSLLA